MLDFQNQTLDLLNLPKFETVEGKPINKAYLKYLRLVYSFWIGLFTLGIILLYFLADVPRLVFYIIIPIVFICFIIYLIEVEKGFPKRKFGLREKDIIFQRGFLFFKQTIVPFNRIQHLEVKQDLIFRWFKIYSIKMFTAGSSSGDLSIAGLNKEDADKLKAIILKVASLEE